MKRAICSAFVVCLAACLSAAECPAGVKATSGKEWGVWGEGQYSVIIARVKKITPLPRELDEGSHRMVIEPLLSLAGTIDPSAQKTLTVTFYAEGDTSIRQVPDAGQLILAVMKWNNFIVSDFCLFMPNQCALTTIRDLNDPDVVLTIKNLQDARAHSDPNPYHPTTKPAEEPRK